MLQLREKGASDKEIQSYRIMIENDIEFFKHQSIKNINKHIPEYLKVLEHFNNWDEAMNYIAKFKAEIPKEMTYDKKD
tara:strand:+ start:421 stop:654 length:234 start_codon:yes stop_codon:yes gene_type:complete